MQRCKDVKKQRNIKKLPIMRLFTIYYLLFTLISTPVYALELDTSINDEIRKNYNPSKIEEDFALPILPKVLDEKSTTVSKTEVHPKNLRPQAVVKTQNKPAVKPISNVYKQKIVKNSEEKYAVLKKGTKIKVKLQSNISDASKKGSRVSFISTYPVSTTYFTIPMGSVFKGKIKSSHKPQFTGNGGLIEISVDSVILNGETQPINAYVTRANSKKIFFNKIKGKRKYLASAVKSAKPGYSFFKKMMRATSNLAQDGSSIVLTPFSVVIGTATFAGNIIAAPAVAVFYKGGAIKFDSGSDFVIKLSQDVFIYN